jgi:FkbM family methyltransferase
MRYLNSIYRVVGAFGILDGGVMLAARAAGKISASTSAIRKLRLGGVPHPVFLRPGTSDWDFLDQVFVSREYECPSEGHNQALFRFYTNCVEKLKVPLIIDCGANIGLASIWYAQKFPRAKIIAVEPEPENFRILAMNATYYPNIVPIHGGISDRQTSLMLSNMGDAPWAWETAESESGPIRAFTIPGLLADVPNAELMIVKIDIEGSEVGLFRSNVDWAHETPVIVFESHDSLFNWRGTFHAVASVLIKRPRDYIQSGENTFSFLHSLGSMQGHPGD